jgi:hypothetical protein
MEPNNRNRNPKTEEFKKKFEEAKADTKATLEGKPVTKTDASKAELECDSLDRR